MSGKDFSLAEDCKITSNGIEVSGFVNVNNIPIIEHKKAEEIKDLGLPTIQVAEPNLLYHSLKDLKKRNKELYLWMKKHLPKKEFNQIDKIYLHTLNPLSIAVKIEETMHSIPFFFKGE